MADKPLFKFSLYLPAIMIIAAATGLSYYWLTNKPVSDRQPPKQVAPVVEFMQVKPTDHRTSVFAMGSVIASQSVNLTSRISGMIIDVSPNFIEGGIVKQGEQIVQLDPTDFRLQVQQKQNDLAQAEFNLKLEQGKQAIALREFQLLGNKLGAQEKELVLRKPHLKAAQASLKAAQAALQQAELDLSRTRTVAPFNAIITARNANIGSWISTFSTGTPLVKLVGTDNFWIDVSLPMDKLRWIDIPGINSETGAPAVITYSAGWGADRFRRGVVKRLKAEVETEGRMAKIIVEVPDPLSQTEANKGAPTLMLGSFVHVQIQGRTLKDIIKLPESTLHDGRFLWLLSQKNTLKIIEVKPTWKEQDYIFLPKEQFPERARIITSDLATPLNGMLLRDQPNS